MNCVLSDLVEDHSTNRHLRLQHLEQMPCDGLALAVLVSGQQEFVGTREQLLQFCDALLFAVVHHVVGKETIIGVDRKFGPRFLAETLGEFGRLAGQVADMPIGRLDVVPLAEVLADGLCLGG